MKKNAGKYRYLFKNIGFLTLSQFASKFLSFFLVPLYTTVLTTAEYGTYDLFNATISVLIPILTLNIQESVIRFSLDKKTSKDSIVTISVKYILLSSVIVAMILALNHVFGFNKEIDNYSFLFFLMFLVQTVSGIMTSYIRGLDRIMDLSVSSVITSLVTIACNVLFLLVFKWGLFGYFIANIVGPLSQCVYLMFRSNYLCNIRFRSYVEEEREMIGYSKPLIANSIAWWVNNVSDRYVIVFFCGLAENGIYSVAGKIPSILNVFQSIFNSAWTLSVVKDYDPEDTNGFFSNTYKAYNCMMVIICSGIILFDKVLAKLLYAKDFFIAWKYVPWLTVAIVFGALSGYLGGFFSAVKDSKIFATSTILGALTNLILNIIFTPIYGAMGAAVATAICYFVVWVFRFFQAKKYIKLRINIKRDFLSYILLVAQGMVICLFEGLAMYILEGVIFAVISLLYVSEIAQVIRKIMRRGRG